MSWRARLGIVYPADGALDDEYWKLVPDGVTVHITRIPVPQEEQTLELLVDQANSPDIEKAAKDLTIIHPDSIGYACTSGSFLRGVGGDLDIIRRMEEAAGVPCTTTITASVNALRALGVEKLAVVTPYPDEINELLHEFLEDSGFGVTDLKGLGLYREISRQSTGAAYQLARAVDSPEAEAVFISCTNFRTLDILDPLEQDLNKPVVSANQATMWELLRLAGVKPRVQGAGTLYQPSSNGINKTDIRRSTSDVIAKRS